jgi:hypothetical protein
VANPRDKNQSQSYGELTAGLGHNEGCSQASIIRKLVKSIMEEASSVILLNCMRHEFLKGGTYYAYGLLGCDDV